MKKKEISDANKLIADFMGCLKMSGYLYYIPEYEEMDKGKYSNQNSLTSHFLDDELKYHSSWDWLKPVIDKIIETIGIKSIDECTSDEWFYSTNITRMYIGVSIEQAHRYVVEFIKWYNTNGKGRN